MDIMSQNIYQIQLLNDLHNHFPEILYSRPDRFRNVQDVIDYIRQVAQTNPYDRGLNQYISHYRNNHQMSYNSMSIPERDYQQRFNVDMPELSYSSVSIPVSSSSILTRFINSLIGNMDDLENVIVQPTAEEIARATTIYPVNNLQDDICIICQDAIESNEVRRITQCRHYFHKICIDTWFQTNVHCPTCRHDIRDISNA